MFIRPVANNDKNVSLVSVTRIQTTTGTMDLNFWKIFCAKSP